MSATIGKAANDNVVPAFGPFPPTMAIAKALGSKYYFTGKPCLRGHVVARYAHGSCTECKAEDRASDREGLAAKARQWRLDNPEKVSAQSRSPRSIESYVAHYEKTREIQIKRATDWKKANPERAAASSKRWHSKPENKAHIRQKISGLCCAFRRTSARSAIPQSWSLDTTSTTSCPWRLAELTGQTTSRYFAPHATCTSMPLTR